MGIQRAKKATRIYNREIKMSHATCQWTKFRLNLRKYLSCQDIGGRIRRRRSAFWAYSKYKVTNVWMFGHIYCHCFVLLFVSLTSSRACRSATPTTIRSCASRWVSVASVPWAVGPICSTQCLQDWGTLAFSSITRRLRYTASEHRRYFSITADQPTAISLSTTITCYFLVSARL